MLRGMIIEIVCSAVFRVFFRKNDFDSFCTDRLEYLMIFRMKGGDQNMNLFPREGTAETLSPEFRVVRHHDPDG